MIYSMSVNVWDWHTEWNDEDDYQKNPKDNPEGSSRGKAGVLRGGSYYSNARETQASIRESVNATYRGFVLGFLLRPSPQYFRDFFLFFLSISLIRGRSGKLALSDFALHFSNRLGDSGCAHPESRAIPPPKM